MESWAHWKISIMTALAFPALASSILDSSSTFIHCPVFHNDDGDMFTVEKYQIWSNAKAMCAPVLSNSESSGIPCDLELLL